MKSIVFKIIFVMMVSIFAPKLIWAQWGTVQTSGTTSELISVKAVNDNIVWICGDKGVVLRTTNGGANWSIKTATNVLYKNYSIEAISDQVAWVIGATNPGGSDFKIWKTTDGGNSWTEQYNNTTGFGNSIRFFDANNGVCFADPDPYGSTKWEILTTSNGGANWNRVSDANYPPADASSEEVGVAGSVDVLGNTIWVGTYSRGGGTKNRIYKSTNMGLNWTVSEYTTIVESYPHYLAFSSATKGVGLTYRCELALSSNGGANWIVSNVYPATYNQITNIPGTDKFIGVGTFGLVSYSSDAGNNWTYWGGIDYPTSGTYKELVGVDASTNFIWAAGVDGVIIKSNGTVLPVEFKSFSAAAVGSVVNLKWETATEINNYGFEVYRLSESEMVWENIGFVNGNGNSNSPESYSYTDYQVPNGNYVYRLKQIDSDGQYEFSQEVKVSINNMLVKYNLHQNYPNPFNPTTTIGYEIAKETHVSLTVFDTMGKEVAILVNEFKPSGYYEVVFNAENICNGVYFYKLQAGDFSDVKKLIYMK